MATESDRNDEDKHRLSLEALHAYRQVLTVHFLAAFVVMIGIAVPLLKLETSNRAGTEATSAITILPVVILSGALGALVSALQRLYKLEHLPAALVHPLPGLSDWHLWLYSLIPPIIGMVGAVLFYLLLAGGIIDGPLFQHFHCDRQGASCDGSLAGLLSYSPQSVQDYAKSIVWGFISGFSERIIPDALARLESTASKGYGEGA